MISVPTEPGQPEAVTLAALAARQVDRWLYIRIFDWKSDTLVNSTLLYRVTAGVRDGKGNPIAYAQIVGRDALDGSVLDPVGAMKVAVPNATRDLLERLLNDPAIARALAGGPPDPAPDVQAPGR